MEKENTVSWGKSHRAEKDEQGSKKGGALMVESGVGLGQEQIAVDCRGKRMRRASLLLERKDGLAASPFTHYLQI